MYEPARILKCHKFQGTSNVPFYYNFCLTFLVCFPTFILFLLLILNLSPSFFPSFHTAGQPASEQHKSLPGNHNEGGGGDLEEGYPRDGEIGLTFSCLSFMHCVLLY